MRTWPKGAEWMETPHLALHSDGRLFRRGRPPAPGDWPTREPMGLIDDDPKVPAALEDEFLELLCAWEDALPCDDPVVEHPEPTAADEERWLREDYHAGLF